MMKTEVERALSPSGVDFIASMSSLDDAWWMLPTPILGQHLPLTDALDGEPIGMLCVELPARLFEPERIVFGR
jgi:hypothetical protein